MTQYVKVDIRKYRADHDELAEARAELAAVDGAAVSKLRLCLQDTEIALEAERQSRREAEALQRDNREAASEYLHLLSFERQLRQKVEQRAERAEALAALVNEGTVALLEWLANNTLWTGIYPQYEGTRIQAARELAAQIREALALEGDDES